MKTLLFAVVLVFGVPTFAQDEGVGKKSGQGGQPVEVPKKLKGKTLLEILQDAGALKPLYPPPKKVEDPFGKTSRFSDLDPSESVWEELDPKKSRRYSDMFFQRWWEENGRGLRRDPKRGWEDWNDRDFWEKMRARKGWKDPFKAWEGTLSDHFGLLPPIQMDSRDKGHKKPFYVYDPALSPYIGGSYKRDPSPGEHIGGILRDVLKGREPAARDLQKFFTRIRLPSPPKLELNSSELFLLTLLSAQVKSARKIIDGLAEKVHNHLSVLENEEDVLAEVERIQKGWQIWDPRVRVTVSETLGETPELQVVVRLKGHVGVYPLK